MDKLKIAPQLLGHQHVEFYHPRKLVEVLEQCGFELETMKTSCLAAPWLAPFSWKFAEGMHDFELKLGSSYGSIICAVFKKRAAI